ncbi:hypothetical protein KC622_01930 [Candidatus Dojkabacteria bacterium]|uniref:Uncharacterized protein n=1 Tax=Candidatus Dojkabacteria bacterium TaxID=2099670 RepID=A0A955HX99_9BACT|nr:hypothetical protein [Candidatus Dojkabacteria bacterium]MCB9791038.1 hypothetical protein [Candidatus Nomurabacteria bacterium]
MTDEEAGRIVEALARSSDPEIKQIFSNATNVQVEVPPVGEKIPILKRGITLNKEVSEAVLPLYFPV